MHTKLYIMKTLFINPISLDISLAILDKWVFQKGFTIPKGDDFSSFPDMLVDIVTRENIWEIWCICGPWAFTRMRIVTLACNTLRLTRWISLKWCHFFNIIDSDYPILRANDREYIIRGEDGDPIFIEKDLLPSATYVGYGEENDFTDTKILIQYTHEYLSIREKFEQIQEVYSLSPIYLKNPHITWSKKNTSPSSEKTRK